MSAAASGQGELLPGVHPHRRAVAAARAAGEVRRDPQREPRLDDPRPGAAAGRRRRLRRRAARSRPCAWRSSRTAGPGRIATGGLRCRCLTIFMSGGCYKVRKIAASFRSVTTNTTPIAAYRGAGPAGGGVPDRAGHGRGRRRTRPRPVGGAAGELHPARARCRMPLSGPGSSTTRATTRGWSTPCWSTSSYEKVTREREERRQDPSRPLLGIGFSTFVELGGIGPTPLAEQFGFIGGWESSTVRMNPDGSVVVSVGTSPHGQRTRDRLRTDRRRRARRRLDGPDHRAPR